MKEQILYRKVFIHGEEDLPKETGFYIANVKDWGISDRHFLVGDKDYLKGWIEDIDWYLLPVPLPNDEEIDKFIEEHPDNTGDLILGAGIAAGFKVGIKWLKSRLTDK